MTTRPPDQAGQGDRPPAVRSHRLIHPAGPHAPAVYALRSGVDAAGRGPLVLEGAGD